MYKKFPFKTSIGSGFCWTDNQFVRVVVDDKYGGYAFRFDNAKGQVDAFIRALVKCAEHSEQIEAARNNKGG
jgi:hypothetical protein